MKSTNTLLLSLLFLFFCQGLYAQEEEKQRDVGTLSGNFQSNANFFVEDSLVGAAGTPQYDHQLYGADAWLQLNYNQMGFDVGLRFDLFNNSNLLNPQDSYSAQGIGRWYIKKKINKLGISGGYLYDQIGSGIIFRAFEQRPLLIDNALYGMRLTYDLTEDWQLKAFTGRQKQQFDLYGSTIRGFSADGFITGGEESKWSLAPGFGAVARTIDDETMNRVVNTIESYDVQDSIGAKYNSYAFSVYNTLTAGRFTWYVEGAYKTAEQFNNPFAVQADSTIGKLEFSSGTVIYSSLSYAQKGLGITVEGKRTENFTFRTDPFVILNRGMINFLPPMARVNTYRLTSRYNAATQELGEQAIQVDVKYSPSRKLSFNVNFSNITDLNNTLLYREIYTEATFKYKRKWQLLGGVQIQSYNQEIFEVKPEAPLVQTVVPFVEFLYKFDRKKSLRAEAQYLLTEQDLGSWAFGLLEYSIAPNWSFTISDMVTTDSKQFFDTVEKNGRVLPQDVNRAKALHFYSLSAVYSYKSNRFSLCWCRQPEGIVCTGGICRYEPAFNGVKLTVDSTF